jgi:hypothetical protein
MKTISAYIGHVDVEIDLDDFDTEDLIEELRSRDDRDKYDLDDSGLHFIRDCLIRNDPAGALAALDTILFPRFGSPAAAMAAYQAARKVAA